MKSEPPAGECWPLLIIPWVGGVFVRWTFPRDVALKIIQGGADDDVIRSHQQGLVLEMSFHDSLEQAEAALQRDIARGTFADATPKGRA